MIREDKLLELEEKTGHKFHDKTLLKQAITHSSFSNEQKINKQKHYERLEFLGDAVLELVSSDFLFEEHPEMQEGQLTKLRASIVCEPSLAFCAREISLGDYLLLGKGEEVTGGRERNSILSDAFEAVIGAIYLDGGFTNAKEFVERTVLSDIEHKTLFCDSKTILQEMIQSLHQEALSYRLLSEEGPEHAKSFTACACLGERILATGSGKTKKAAEQEAAYKAVLILRNKENQ